MIITVELPKSDKAKALELALNLNLEYLGSFPGMKGKQVHVLGEGKEEDIEYGKEETKLVY